jgi:RHS repeat-associated protein
MQLFLYDGWNLIQEMDGTGAIQKAYIYGLDLSLSTEGAGGVGGLISVVDTGEVYHFLYDANGNVGQLIDADDGSIVAHYEYDPFGILLKSYGTKSDDNPFRFSTKYYDTENGFYYYGYRFYSPILGRWITRDPIEEKGGLNLYVFSNNSPLNFVDAKGLSWIQNNCQALSTEASISSAVGIGIAISAGIKWTTCDCCNTETGRTSKSDYYDVTVDSNISVIIGFAAQEQFPIIGRVGWDIRIAQITKSNSVSCTKNADKIHVNGTGKYFRYQEKLAFMLPEVLM